MISSFNSGAFISTFLILSSASIISVSALFPMLLIACPIPYFWFWSNKLTFCKNSWVRWIVLQLWNAATLSLASVSKLKSILFLECAWHNFTVLFSFELLSSNSNQSLVDSPNKHSIVLKHMLIFINACFFSLILLDFETNFEIQARTIFHLSCCFKTKKLSLFLSLLLSLLWQTSVCD